MDRLMKDGLETVNSSRVELFALMVVPMMENCALLKAKTSSMVTGYIQRLTAIVTRESIKKVKRMEKECITAMMENGKKVNSMEKECSHWQVDKR